MPSTLIVADMHAVLHRLLFLTTPVGEFRLITIQVSILTHSSNTPIDHHSFE